MSDFTGFPSDGLALLTELPRHDKDWFHDHKSDYEATIAEPAKAFVTDIGERLRADVSPTIEAVPKTNGSIAPINNDVRFNPNADPYKDFLLFKFWDGPDKSAAPTLFVRLGEETVGFGIGMRFTDIDRWREAVDDDRSGAELADAIDTLSKRRDLEAAGADLKRVPNPYDADHPRADLLRHKWIQLRWAEPTPKSVTTAKFVDWTAKRLAACAPVEHWLVEHLT